MAVAVAISALAAGVWFETVTWLEARNLAQDPTVLPRAVAVILWLSAIGLVVKAVRAMVRPSENAASGSERSQSEDSEHASLTGALIAIVVVAVYAWTAFAVGWITTTLVFFIGGAVALNRERLTPIRVVVAVVVASVVVAVVWFGFAELLNVRMPDTVLP